MQFLMDQEIENDFTDTEEKEADANAAIYPCCSNKEMDEK